MNFTNFTVEVERSLRVLDGAVAVFDGVAGVEPQSETVWRQADRYKVPRIAFINKLDRTGAVYTRTYDMLIERLNAPVVLLQLPIGTEGEFAGIVDLIDMKAYVWDLEANKGDEFRTEEIPANMLDEAKAKRAEMIEKLADIDDSIMKSSGVTTSTSIIGSNKTGFAFLAASLNATKDRRERIGKIYQMHANKREERESATAGLIVAVMGLKDTTTGDTLCDQDKPVVLESMDFPDPVIHVAIEPKTKNDQDKLATAIQRLAEEDPTFHVRGDEETGQTIIGGMRRLAK